MNKTYYNLQEILCPLVPKAALPLVVEMLERYPIHLCLKPARKTVLGDYLRRSGDATHHRITVNADLNNYDFLITFVHEYAHLLVADNPKLAKVNPHGTEWKHRFRNCMMPFLTTEVFPEKILQALFLHLEKAPASHRRDLNLVRVLSQYDASKGKNRLENLELHATFLYQKNLYRLERKLEKNYLCIRLKDRVPYKFSPLVEIEKIVAE